MAAGAPARTPQPNGRNPVVERLSDAVYRLADTGASIAALENTLVHDAGGQDRSLLGYCASLRSVKGELRKIEDELARLADQLAA